MKRRSVKGASKTKKNFGKRTIRAKAAPRARAGASSSGFELNVPAALGKKLSALAEIDTNFKGKSPERYAMFIIKNAVAHPNQTLSEKT